jgi:hypothetical protein
MSQAAIAQSPGTEAPDDAVLLQLLDIAERAVSSRSRIPVLSLWHHIPSVALLASHLHLKWPGRVNSLPITPRIGLFPFFGSDFELLSQPLYEAQTAQTERQKARTGRLRIANGAWGRSDLYQDWEQALDRRRSKIGSLILPASSYISIDRVTETGQIKAGNRGSIGKFAPRHAPRPRILVPAKAEVTRQLVREFDGLDLVLVNVQNIRGRQLTRSVEFFLSHISPSVPMLILASSPADLVLTGALNPPALATTVFSAPIPVSSFEVKLVNRDRPLRERQLSFALDGLDTRSALLERLVVQAKRTWWATRQSLVHGTPREAAAFETLCADMTSRLPGEELELLSEVRRLIAEESAASELRQERRQAVIDAALHDSGSRTVLIIVRSDAAADDLRAAISTELGVEPSELFQLGIHVITVFSPWPSMPYDTCITAGYFGTNTIDMLFASRAKKRKLIVDPIEARVAVWDSERRFSAVLDLPPGAVESLRTLTELLEPHACPSSDPISLSSLFPERHTSASFATNPETPGKPLYVCICFADGSARQVPANARFEVLGRKRLQLQSVTAKDLSVGDQVVLLHDDERAAFSEKLLRLLDQGKFRQGSSTRSSWINMIRLVRAQTAISATTIKRELETAGVCVHVTTVNSWLPSSAEDDCGIPDTLPVFLAFASALGIALPEDVLKQWFADIHRLRVDHRKIGRQLARAIRGAYLSRLDPVTVARMEREWGLQAKMLLEAARVAVVDDVIPFTQ